MKSDKLLTLIGAQLPGILGALAAAMLLFPLALRWSRRLGLVDEPGGRKVHRSSVPVIGGMVIVLAVAVGTALSPGLQWLAGRHASVFACMLALLVTGVADDRLSLSSRLRFLIQTACAVAVAADGFRIQSLQGLFGVDELPVAVQYIITVVVIVGVTNAFNLIDGIDGLAGGMALINFSCLCLLGLSIGKPEWLFLLLPLATALLVFLRYNWRPARVFMGDGGSLVLGFIVPVVGLWLIRASYATGGTGTGLAIVVVTGCCMIPVLDTLRVGSERIRNGKSPFSADRSHLHHLIIRHRLTHAQATGRILMLHAAVIVMSVIAIQFVGLLWVIALQAGVVGLYTVSLRLFARFVDNYRFIRKLERSGSDTPEV